MYPFSDPHSLLIKLQETDDYNERLSLIERNVDRFDASFVEAFDEVVAFADNDSSLESHLASFRAITLAEVTYVQGKRGNIEAARRFGAHCLKAYQKALYLRVHAGIDRAKKTNSLLEALLVDAGEFRGYGLEEEGWQAYWIADPIFAAMDTVGDSVSTGQLLTAAVILEQVGMLERAEKARQEALAKIGNAALFRKEKAMAAKIVGPPPTEVPPPDIYDGLTMESALRFSSQSVAVRCVQQTRCPKCRGPMKYEGSQSFVHKDGYYRRCELTCQKDKRHPALTLFRNSLLLPGAQIFAGLGSKLDREEGDRLDKSSALSPRAPATPKKVSRRRISRSEPASGAAYANPPAAGSVQADTANLLASYLMERSPEERAEILEPYKEYFKPHWPGPRALLVSGTIFLIISVWTSIVPSLLCYLVFRWSGLPSPFLRVLFGCLTGLVVLQLFLLLAGRSALQSFVRRIDLIPTVDRSAKVSGVRIFVVSLISLAAGCAGAFLIGGWAGATAMPLAALNLRVVLRRMKEKSGRRDQEGRSK